MLTTFMNTLMSAEADAVCGAPYGETSPERTNVRNGYRHREFDTRAGTLDVAIPKLREGSYFPDWLLERRRRAERALTTVVATCYLLGVSTRRMEKLVDALGITRLSKSQVSVMAAELDAQVAEFRGRPLDAGPYTFVAADALVLKVREGGRVVNVHALVATGVNADGHREILGLQVSSAEDGAGWLGFFRDLTARGLSGVALVTSDAHNGLVAAIGATLPGASWQRCRTHWICKETTCSSRLWCRMMRYGCRRRGPRSACPAVRGAVAALERTSATSGTGDGGPAAGARRDPGGRRCGQRQRYHRAHGCGRTRGR
jgi:putative transposase